MIESIKYTGILIKIHPVYSQGRKSHACRMNRGKEGMEVYEGCCRQYQQG